MDSDNQRAALELLIKVLTMLAWNNLPDHAPQETDITPIVEDSETPPESK